VIYYFLKEIKYYALDEATAREVTRRFKERIYDIRPDESPAEVLVELAEREFGLRRLDIPEPYQDAVVQRFDRWSDSRAGRDGAHSERIERGEAAHDGIHLR
jgi:hypothetical protein